GELPGAGHKVHPFETVLKEGLVQKIKGEVVPQFDLQGVFVQFPSGDHLFKKSIGIGDDQVVRLSGIDTIDQLGTQQYVGIVRLLDLIGPSIAAGVEKHIALPE